MKTKTDWSKPMETSRLNVVFGAEGSHIPALDEMPENFANPNGRNEWKDLQRKWFFEGIAGYSFEMKEGIDKDAAFAHLKAIQSTWAIKHQHKESAVAWLMSLWIEKVRAPARPLGSKERRL